MISGVAVPCRPSATPSPHPSIQLFPCLMLHILSFFRALAVRDPLLSFLLRMCVRERKRQCYNLRGILALKDRVQLHRGEPPTPCIHKHTLTHTPPAVCLAPITAVPVRPVRSGPPPGPITTFLPLLFLAQRRTETGGPFTAKSRHPLVAAAFTFSSFSTPPPLSPTLQTAHALLHTFLARELR